MNTGSLTDLTDHLVEQIADAVRGGRTPDDAARRLALMLPGDQVQKALQRYKEAARRVRTAKEPRGFYNKSVDPWYLGPPSDGKLWNAFRASLQKRGWDEDGVGSIDGTSTRIVSMLDPPNLAKFSTRGLVVGHVQSGKTANFTGVIAKAADAGYRCFIVLSGLNNALRNQTQARLEDDLVSQNPESWIWLTYPEIDFQEKANANAFLSERYTLKVLGVVKKQASRLKRLNAWLQSARPEVLRACPVLIIDDEADQASPNAHPDPEERTAINRLIIQLLDGLPKAAYVGYTATPFANLLIDPSESGDLYPGDFIIDIPRGRDYFGAEQIFGRPPLDHTEEAVDGLNMIRIVPIDEAHKHKPLSRESRYEFVPAITDSLRRAMLYFWIATAERLRRGQSKRHSSMLIHTTQYSVVHSAAKNILRTFQAEIAELFAACDAGLLKEMADLWREEQDKVPPESAGEARVDFAVLRAHVLDVLTRSEVKVENGVSLERIDYSPAAGGVGRIYVVVGGNVLSRGLTLEGLLVSFFVRSASAYDTLLQMGRWFGYRHGYADLPRVWMTDELRGYFFDLAGVEREIRLDIQRYSGGDMTPRDFGVRIRTHPALAITARLKMQHAVKAKMAFDGRAVQTIVFPTGDAAWLGQNIEAVKVLLAGLMADGLSSTSIEGRPHPIFEGASSSRILEFLEAFRIDPLNVSMPSNQLRGYIRDQNSGGRLTQWNVGVVTRQEPYDRLGSIDLGSVTVPLINRSRFVRDRPPGRADIKALMSEIDIGIDMAIETERLRRSSREALLNLREEQLPDRGALLIYPIGKSSVPIGKPTDERQPLEAAQDVIGIALVFPKVPQDAITPQDYVTVDLDLPDSESEEVEYDDLMEPESS